MSLYPISSFLANVTVIELIININNYGFELTLSIEPPAALIKLVKLDEVILTSLSAKIKAAYDTRASDIFIIVFDVLMNMRSSDSKSINPTLSSQLAIQKRKS